MKYNSHTARKKKAEGIFTVVSSNRRSLGQGDGLYLKSPGTDDPYEELSKGFATALGVGFKLGDEVKITVEVISRLKTTRGKP